MTVHSTLHRSKDQVLAMDRKKADIGLMPAVDFWFTPKEKNGKEPETTKKDLYVSVEIPY